AKARFNGLPPLHQVVVAAVRQESGEFLFQDKTGLPVEAKMFFAADRVGRAALSQPAGRVKKSGADAVPPEGLLH
mgnify:CR=1